MVEYSLLDWFFTLLQMKGEEELFHHCQWASHSSTDTPLEIIKQAEDTLVDNVLVQLIQYRPIPPPS